MRQIPLDGWSRRDHFETYINFEQPHFSMCANMDVSTLYPWTKQHGHSFSVVVVYVISRAANAIPILVSLADFSFLPFTLICRV